MLHTIDVEVLIFSEDDVFPSRDSEDPGIFLRVHSGDGMNSTVDVAGLSIGLKNLVLDHEALQCVTEEDDPVRLEDDGHDRYTRSNRGFVGAFTEDKAKRSKWLTNIALRIYDTAHGINAMHTYFTLAGETPSSLPPVPEMPRKLESSDLRWRLYFNVNRL